MSSPSTPKLPQTDAEMEAPIEPKVSDSLRETMAKHIKNLKSSK
jgi:hypothetical protein